MSDDDNKPETKEAPISSGLTPQPGDYVEATPDGGTEPRRGIYFEKSALGITLRNASGEFFCKSEPRVIPDSEIPPEEVSDMLAIRRQTERLNESDPSLG